MVNPNPPNQPVTYEGSRHCGAVRFRVPPDQDEAIDCNYSICSKKALLHLILSNPQFNLLQKAEVLSTYPFNTRTVKHLFCPIYGSYPFSKSHSDPKSIKVNLPRLAGDQYSRFTIRPFEDTNWENNIDELLNSERANC